LCLATCKHVIDLEACLHLPAWHASIVFEDASMKRKKTSGKARGGFARRDALKPEARKEIAKKTAEARWGSAPIEALRIGKLAALGDAECAVLVDGRRVISVRGVQRLLGRRPAGGRVYIDRVEDGADVSLPVYLAPKNLKLFISEELDATSRVVIPYRHPKNKALSYGIEAKQLPQICDVWLKARDAGVLQASQEATALKADIVMRALAHVGIIALVDEATGHQYDRARNALAEILEAFIAKELAAWVKTFGDDYYAQLFRLRGLKYDEIPSKKPAYVGHLTNDIVYKRLAPGVLDELKKMNPIDDEKGRRRAHHHKWLMRDVGHPKLKDHLTKLTVLMSASTDWKHFKTLLDRALPQYGKNYSLLLGEPDPGED